MGDATAKKLPSSLRLKTGSFYDAADSITDVQSGSMNEIDYVVFEHHANHGDFTYKQTIAAIRTETDTPTTNLSLTPGLRFERLGEWLVVLEPERSVGNAKHLEFVRDCLSLIDYAKDRQN
jgi:hypothetical protein